MAVSSGREAGKGPLFLYRKVSFHQGEEIVGSSFGQLFPYVFANPFQIESEINFPRLPVFKNSVRFCVICSITYMP